MKKLKILLCTLLAAGGLVASAEPFTVTVNVDDATHVKCVLYNNGTYEDIYPEGNSFVFELESSTGYYMFSTVEPWGIKDIIDSNGYSKKSDVYEGGRWDPYFYKTETYNITTYNVDEARTGTFTVNVDDASKVLMRRSDYSEIPLSDGANPVKFDPEDATEKVVSIEARDYGEVFYKVLVDGTEISARYGQYTATIADGSVIDITTAFPDLPATVTFSYNTGGEGCITNVRLDGESVSDFNGRELTCKVGQKLSFESANNWYISSYSVNGESSSYFYKYDETVLGDLAFSFIAEYNDPSVTVNISIDDASHVTLRNTTTNETISLVNGDNSFTVERYNSIEMAPVEPWAIQSILNLDTQYEESIYSGKWSKYISTAQNNYKVTTYNLEESRTATATINVDDAERVILRRQSDYATIELENGSNTIKFNPNTETIFSVCSSTNTPLYEVTLNGEPVVANYGSYNLSLTDNCVVDITAIIPDKDITATFSYTNEDGFGCVSEVLVDGVKVEDFDGYTLNLKAGQTVKLSFDALFAVDEFRVNGTVTSVYGSYSTTLMNDVTFGITAHKLGTIKATVKVDDPSNIIFGIGGYNVSYGATIRELQAGDNEIELPENNTVICWQAVNGSFIESVDVNGTIQSEYTTSYSLKEGDVVTFTTGKITYDLKAIVWIDNKDAASTYFAMGGGSYNDRTTLEVSTGYNEIAFRKEMLPISLSWYDPAATVGEVYLNGELVQPQYSGSNNYALDMKDGDVVKIFLATTPVTHTVTFDVEEGIDVAATTDRITAVEDLTQALTVFAGTEVAFTAESDEQFIVKNGDDELEPGEDGKYIVTVDGETALSVKKVQKGEFSVALDKTEITLVEDETATLTATITKGDDVTVESQEFTSSDAAVATVSAEGVITAVAQGKATITLTATDNYGRTATATCEVTVTEKSGIAEIDAAAGAETIYDLQGRRVNKAGHGLYIVNGRKVRL